MLRNRNIAVLLLVSVCMMGLAFTSTAQDSLSFDDVVTDTASGEAFNYTLSLEAYEMVVIILESDDFDPILTLLDPSGDEVAFDDDSAGSLNSQISYSALVEGDYTIVGNAFNGNPTGDYTVRILGGTCIFAEDTASGGSIPYPLTISEGDIVFVEVASETFDATLSIVDSDGTEIVADNDGGEGTNSQIAFIVPADDTYQLIISSLDDEPVGDFSVVVTGGILIEGTITEPSESITVEWVAGEPRIISLTADDFNPVVRINDAQGTELASNADQGSVLTFNPPENGEYTIAIDAVDSTPNGDYQLGIITKCAYGVEEGADLNTQDNLNASGDLLADFNTRDTGAIAVAESMTATAEGTVDIYTISLDEGQTVTINLSSEDFDTVVLIIDESQTMSFGYNDDIDYPENTNSEAVFTAPSAGNFKIVVSSFTGDATGEYTLSVQ